MHIFKSRDKYMEENGNCMDAFKPEKTIKIILYLSF